MLQTLSNLYPQSRSDSSWSAAIMTGEASACMDHEVKRTNDQLAISCIQNQTCTCRAAHDYDECGHVLRNARMNALKQWRHGS